MADLCTTIYKLDPNDPKKVIKETQQTLQEPKDLKMLEMELTNKLNEKQRMEIDIMFLQNEISEIKKVLNIK